MTYQLSDTVFIHKLPKKSYLQISTDSSFAVEINTIAVKILELCNGKNSLNDIYEILLQEYDSEYQEIKHLVDSFISDAEKEKWIMIKDENVSAPKMNISGNFRTASPTSISIEITKKCPLRCIHCYTSASPEDEMELSLEKLKMILDEAAALGVFSIMLTGGEVFEYKYALSIINDYSKKFKHFIIASNGYYINEEILNSLDNNKNLTIRISLDGDRATHNMIRQNPESYDRALNAIKMLNKHHISNVAVMTLSQINYRQLGETVKKAKDTGANSFEYGFVLNLGRATKNMELSIEEIKEINKLASYLRKKYNANDFKVLSRAEEYEKMTRLFKPTNCGAGYFQFAILADGSIVPCLSMPYRFTNINSTTLTDYINSLDFIDFLQQKAPPTSDCEGCANIEVCSGCFARALSVDRNCKWSSHFLNISSKYETTSIPAR